MKSSSVAPTTCAACGKEDGNSLKACTACKSVKYCNRDCQIAHRSSHKKICKARAAELYDEALFKEHTPEECPICFLSMPLFASETTFQSCCGKLICNGCIYAMMLEAGGREICAFCREPSVNCSDEEIIKRTKKLMKSGNAEAFNSFGSYYIQGGYGLPQDRAKAHELWLRAGELGCAPAHYNLGFTYDYGSDDVEIDQEKAKYFYELAAMNGSISARQQLGCIEGTAGNHNRSMKHLTIAAKTGDKESLFSIKKGFMMGIVAKDEYERTLRAYHVRQGEIKSSMRDKALVGLGDA